MSPVSYLGSTVLCVGEDSDLLWIRALVLQHAGYVVCALSGSGVLEARELPKVAFAVLCHSVTLQLAEVIA